LLRLKRGRGVTQQVCTFVGDLDAGTLESVFDDGRDPISGGKGSIRSDAPNKHVIGIADRGPSFQIAEHRVAHILRKRQPYLVSPFPDHLQCATIPVDVWEFHMKGVAASNNARSFF
jgi:hypothetical protein